MKTNPNNLKLYASPEVEVFELDLQFEVLDYGAPDPETPILPDPNDPGQSW